MKDLMKIVIVLFTFSGSVFAQDAGKADTSDKPVMYNSAEITWIPAIALGKGAEMAILAGNPAEAGLFTIRLKFPANYEIKPHRHPGMEHVSIVEGDLYTGTGEVFSKEKATSLLKPGGFVAIPQTVAHYGYTKGQVIIQVTGVGPLDVLYVNKQDDPRMGKKGP